MTDVADRLTAALADRYRLERPLGEGGMAIVYLAEDLRHHRKVAVKVLRPELGAAVGGERFLREIEIAAGLRHPHILPLYDSGEAEGLLYYVMPLVEGESLRARIGRERQLPMDDALRYAREVADALSYAHAHGVVHRDIKPENILIESGHAVVADFGIAKAVAASSEATALTGTGMSIGTPAYMSPEQATGGSEDVDGRSDLYSLGCVLYEMLAGQPPFTGATTESLVRQHVMTSPPPVTQFRPAVPAVVSDALMRALAKAPADRFNPVGQFSAALSEQHAAMHGATRAATGAAADDTTTRVNSTRGGSRRHLAIAAGVVLALALSATGYAWYARRALGGAATPSAPRSVAVLPFENIGSDTSNAYFADGMTDELMNALGTLTDLRVASRGSAFAFKGRNADAREVGRLLGVTHVVEGSARRSGGRLRLSARLVSTANNYEVWSRSYDRDLTDVFAVQDELARAITGELDASLRGTRSALPAAGTSNLAAYDLYLRGRYLWNHRTTASLDQAVRVFSEASTLDPGYALAYAGLADVYLVYPEYADRPQREYLPKVQAAASKALALDSTLSQPHATLAAIAHTERRLADAERQYRRAIALDPKNATARHWYALWLAQQGRSGESLSEIETARRLDPLSPIIATVYASWFYLARDYPRAIRESEQVLSGSPGFAPASLMLARSQGVSGNHAQALAAVQRAAAVTRRDEHAELGWILGRMGRRREADSLLTLVRRRAAREHVSAGTFLLMHLGLGNHDSAFAWANRAADDLDPKMRDFTVDPRFDPLRKDPRYKALLARMNIE